MSSSPKTYAREALIATIIGVLAASYFSLASGKYYWPFSHPSGSVSNKVPTSYQHTWDGAFHLPVFSAHLSLTLGAGAVKDVVGQISTSQGCVTAVILEKGGGPIDLSLDSSNSPVECQVLFSAFDHATVGLVDADTLKFSVSIGGRTVSCYLHR